MNTTNAIHLDKWVDVGGGNFYNTTTHTLTLPNGETIQTKPINLSERVQQNLNNFWAVVNGEKTYKEAFPEKE